MLNKKTEVGSVLYLKQSFHDHIVDAQNEGKFRDNLTFNKWHSAGQQHGYLVKQLLEEASPEDLMKEDSINPNDNTAVMITAFVIGALSIAILVSALVYCLIKQDKQAQSI